MLNARQSKRLLREKKLTVPPTIDMRRGEQATLLQVKGIAGKTFDNPVEVNAMGRRSASARRKTYKTTTTRHQAPLGHSGQGKGQAPATVDHPGKTCLFCG